MQGHRLINDVLGELIRKKDEGEPPEDQFGLYRQAETPHLRTSAHLVSRVFARIVVVPAAFMSQDKLDGTIQLRDRISQFTSDRWSQLGASSFVQFNRQRLTL